MGSAGWSIFTGVIVYIIGLIFAIVYYNRYEKVYLVTFVASICTYIFSVFYLWDVFILDKNMVLLLLFISTIIMMFLGKYFSKLDLKNTLKPKFEKLSK